MSDKMQAEFEIWYAEHEKSRAANGWLPLGGFVKAQMLKAFIGSRESLVVELPPFFNHPELDQCVEVGELVKAIESLGLRVKS